MIVSKYIIEYFDDEIHLSGYHKYYEIFVEKYKIIIRINENNDIEFIKHSDKPNNIYKLPVLFLPQPTCNIQEIECNDEFINNCYELYLKKEETFKLFNPKSFYTNEEYTDIVFKQATQLFNNNKFNESIIKFQDVFDFTKDNKYKINSLYNIACCYSRLGNSIKLYEYLNLSIKHGYKDWQNLIEDNDLHKFRHTNEFVNIVKILYEKYKNKYTGPYEEYIEYIIEPSNMKYLEKHNIIINTNN